MRQAIVTLKKGEGRLLKSGGAWIFDNEIDSIMGEFENGDIVIVHDFDGYGMGRGFINSCISLDIADYSRINIISFCVTVCTTEYNISFFTSDLDVIGNAVISALVDNRSHRCIAFARSLVRLQFCCAFYNFIYKLIIYICQNNCS